MRWVWCKDARHLRLSAGPAVLMSSGWFIDGDRRSRCRVAGSVDRVRPVVDDTSHDDGRGDLLDAGQPAETGVAKLLIGVDVGGGDAHEVVGVAEEPLGVADLRDVDEALLESR
jgi:hypothetical protein